MNQYVGKLCPFCKSAMQETEEIVVCSACEMPHHKECWIENQGCTTFGCLGTIQSPRQTAQPSYVQRSESGNFQAIRFDRPCAAPAPQTAFRAFPSPDPTTEQFIAEKTEYYLPIFQTLRANHALLSWNWAAFLFAPFWLLYRKMYGLGAVVLLAACVVTMLSNLWLWLLLTLGYAVLAMFANYLYLLQIEELVADAAKLLPVQKENLLLRKGGVNIAAATIGAAVYLIVLIISLFA